MKPAGWRWRAVLLLLLLLAGCRGPVAVDTAPVITYVADRQVQELLDREEAAPEPGIYRRPRFVGLRVPENFLAFEPFVLGLATASPVPTILYLDAPWVQRYASAGWLYELERPGVFPASRLVPAIAAAFSGRPPGRSRSQKPELLAVPHTIKGNVLFYRKDLLEKYRKVPPRTWEELKAICREILPRERTLRYGLLFHVNNFVNDFYPILWGFGGQVVDEDGNLVLTFPEMQPRFLAALTEILSWRGTISPAAADLPRFAVPQSLRRSFFRGEALFMINWNTRLQDLKELLAREGPQPGGLTNLTQVGIVPIPAAHPEEKRASNVGSFGWGINRFAVTSFAVMQQAKNFLELVVNERFQLLLAEETGQVPSLLAAVAQVKNPQVTMVYREVFAHPGVVLRARPRSRSLNNILEKHLVAALYGQQSAQATLQAVLQELNSLAVLD